MGTTSPGGIVATRRRSSGPFTKRALQRIASDNPPENAVMLLGYAGWSSGQLEEEILQNGWLTTPATAEIIFNTPHSEQYGAALATLGISEELCKRAAEDGDLIMIDVYDFDFSPGMKNPYIPPELLERDELFLNGPSKKKEEDKKKEDKTG